jgi:hypothetical protein
MEGLIQRTYLMGAVLILLGGAFAYSKSTLPPPKTEEWMEDQAPLSFGRYRYIAGSENPKQTYKMDATTYEMLRPYGIVSRVYESGPHRYDVVLIASRDKDSFHDPRVCFKGQGWTLGDQYIAQVPTQTRGTVPITLTRMAGQPGERLAAFFYRGPGGFVGTTNHLKWDMFKSELLRGENPDAVFYRVIPHHAGATEEEIIAFIGEYLDASGEASNGYF